MHQDVVHYLSVGALLGISAGLAPGPLLALVISETLRHGVQAGVRIAFAPVLTDLPIILATWFLVSGLADFHPVLGVISLLGAAFVFSMGYEGLRTTGIDVSSAEGPAKSLTKGVLANFLSPHPYLFWFGVGAPIMSEASAASAAAPWVFVVSFYLLLVGSKLALALIAGRSRSYLNGRVYRNLMRLLGLLLMLLAGLLARDGLELLGLIGG
ncbi:LysE family transporter [Thiorhodococcus fuscus]|uniref:LysE family transporter n=1 Tax=Thiorhodococcus fuscus TaxID=527200 RepID=A0ABW4YA78_9GAMM